MNLISIIMPIYNKEKFLEKSISSVLKQTFQDFELLLIDDGSIDKSRDIIKNMMENEPRIKYFTHQNRGVSYTRNKGIREATGNYITFLDADDRWEENFLFDMITKINDNDVCYCGHYLVNEVGLKKAKINFTQNNLPLNYLKNRTTPHTNSWLIKKTYIKDNNIIFDENLNWGEDILFFTKILMHTEKVTFVKKYLTYYYLNNIGSLSEENIDKIEKDIVWINKLLKYISEHTVELTRRQQLINTLESYRLPGAIIYRLFRMRKRMSKNELNSYINKYQDIIDSVDFSNGIRSVKMKLYRNKLLKFNRE